MTDLKRDAGRAPSRWFDELLVSFRGERFRWKAHLTGFLGALVAVSAVPLATRMLWSGGPLSYSLAGLALAVGVTLIAVGASQIGSTP